MFEKLLSYLWIVRNLRRETILVSVLLLASFIMRIEYLTGSMDLARVLKSFLLLIFLLLIIYHIFLNKIDFEKDEYLVILFTIMAYLSGFIINGEFCLKNVGVPLEFLLSYLGFSCYLKLKNLNLKDIYWVFGLFFLLYFIHIIIAINTAPSFNYNFSMNLHTYLRQNWENLPYARGDLALYCMSGAIIVTSFTLQHFEKRNNKLGALFLVFTLFMFITIIINGSRSAMFGYGLYVIVTFILSIKYNKLIEILNSKKVRWIVFFAVVITFILLVYYGLLQGFIMKFSKGTTYRYDNWVAFLNEKFNNVLSWDFFFGEGFCRDKISPMNPQWTMHNLFLETWGRSGIFAMGILIYLFLYILIRNLKRKDFWFISAAIFAFVGNGLFESDIVITNTNIGSLFFVFVILFSLRFGDKEK